MEVYDSYTLGVFITREAAADAALEGRDEDDDEDAIMCLSLYTEGKGDGEAYIINRER